MTSFLRKTFVGAVAALSLATAAATPASADWRGHRHGGGNWGPGIAAGVIGGLALGAIAAGAARNRAYAYEAPAYAPEPYYPAPAYAAPAYADPGYGYGYEACHKEWRPVYRTDGTYVRDRLVNVCN